MGECVCDVEEDAGCVCVCPGEGWMDGCVCPEGGWVNMYVM